MINLGEWLSSSETTFCALAGELSVVYQTTHFICRVCCNRNQTVSQSASLSVPHLVPTARWTHNFHLLARKCFDVQMPSKFQQADKRNMQLGSVRGGGASSRTTPDQSESCNTTFQTLFFCISTPTPHKPQLFFFPFPQNLQLF